MESISRVSRLERARSAASAESAAISSAVLLADPVSHPMRTAVNKQAAVAELNFGISTMGER
jgi:hypothetical protein